MASLNGPIARQTEGVLHWSWPSAPRKIDIYDKYSQTTSVLRQSDQAWAMSRELLNT